MAVAVFGLKPAMPSTDHHAFDNQRCSMRGLVLSFALLFPTLATAADFTVASSFAPAVKVIVTDLRRSDDNTTTLRFTVVNDSDEEQRYSVSHISAVTLSNVYLADFANRKKYLPMNDGSGQCACGGIDQTLSNKPHAKSDAWIKFGPIPAGTKISIVLQGFPPIENVPVQ